MKINKSLLRLTATVILVITVMLSLSSCVLDFGIFDDYLPDFDNDYSDGFGNNDEQKPDYTPDTTPSDEDRETEFYPDSGKDDTSGLSPLAKTMLSTVTIISGEGYNASAGSGVFYSVDRNSGDAYVVTNYHVVYSESQRRVADKIEIYLYGMELSTYAIPAVFIGGSVTYDIALLKITGSEVIKNSYATAAQLAPSDGVRVFDKVYAVGNAEGGGLSVTEGIVSVNSESISLSAADGSLITLRVIRVDAAVNHGNSGGGLYDEDGRLIGIVAAKEVSEDIDNMGYAIHSDLVRQVVESILYYCNGYSVKVIKKPLMGITITTYVSGLKVDPDGKNVNTVGLVEIIEIASGSIAEGKLQVGDIINSITIDGAKREVSDMHHVTEFMLSARVGSKVILNVTRGGERVNVVITLTDACMTSVS